MLRNFWLFFLSMLAFFYVCFCFVCVFFLSHLCNAINFPWPPTRESVNQLLFLLFCLSLSLAYLYLFSMSSLLFAFPIKHSPTQTHLWPVTFTCYILRLFVFDSQSRFLIRLSFLFRYFFFCLQRTEFNWNISKTFPRQSESIIKCWIFILVKACFCHPIKFFYYYLIIGLSVWFAYNSLYWYQEKSFVIFSGPIFGCQLRWPVFSFWYLT